MIATGTTLGCGMSICLMLFTGDASAIDTELPPPMRYEFATGTVIVQPGLPSASMKRETLAVDPKRIVEPQPQIQLTNFTQLPPPPLPVDTNLVEVPVDAALVSQNENDPPTPATESKPKETTPAPMTSEDVAARAQRYREIYNSIPFSRAEFNANPSYRHDATMEFLFGQMRPTVINRPARTTIDVRMPAMPYGFGNDLYFNRYGLHSRWSPFMHPPYRW